MKTFKNFFLLFAILETGWVFGNSNTVRNCAKQGKFVQFDIQGKKYENMIMKVVSTIPEANYIAGKSSDNYHWTFHIPDSLSQNIWTLQLFFMFNNDKLGITFTAIIENDTLTTDIDNFENKSSRV